LLAQHLPLVQALGVKAVIEAGSGAPCASAQSLPGYQFAGKLDPHALSDLLQHNLFALIDYPSIHLGKSTVFAAYAANGCVVLNTAAPGADADGLEAGVHYLSLPGLRKRPLQDAHAAPRWQQITVAAQSWYAQHTLPHQAAEFLAVLREHKVKPAAGLASAPLRQEAAHG
jgi:hypothetical protein